TFNSAEFGNVRTVVIDGQPWFVGKDVATSLGYKDTVNALKSHVDDDDKLGWQFTTSGQRREMTVINESGLYSLILGSKLESAKKFKHWVTSEVLPSIRKTGSYQVIPPKVDERAIALEEKKAGLARAEFLRSMALEYDGKSETYKQVLDAYAAKELTGEFILPLPQVAEKSYSATEVGKMFGVSANKIGSVAIQHDLKVQGYGAWVKDKARFSNKEVETFRYNDRAVEEIGRILKLEAEKNNFTGSYQ
ncbi:MAG: BRO-N domain-containing protein, partial [Eubacteriales bacterium]